MIVEGCIVSECVFLYSNFVRLCVRFMMVVADQLGIRVFLWEGFPFFKKCRTKRESSLFPKINITRKSFTHC